MAENKSAPTNDIAEKLTLKIVKCGLHDIQNNLM